MNFLNTDQEQKINLKSFDINIFPKEETLMSIGNGYIVSRGTNDEYNTSYSRETYISGLFNSNCTHEVEELVNVPDVFEYHVLVNGARIDFNSTNVYDYNKTLDIKYGILSKSFMVYHGDLEIFVKTKKYCDMVNKGVVVQEIEYTTNKECEIKIIDKIDGQYTNQGVEHFIYEEKYVNDGILNYFCKTANNKELYISSSLIIDYPVLQTYSIKRKVINRETTFEAKPGISVKFKKATEFSEVGFTNCSHDLSKHKASWDHIWHDSRVVITGDAEVQQAIDFSVYHLVINSNLDDENTNLGAKGMTGFGYKGHTFWDTEIFLLPFYVSTFPNKAKSLIKYRANSIKQARIKAKKYGFDGAMFPWEGTRPESPDATPEYGPINIKTGKVEKIINAEKEIHINTAVVYGIELFYKYTKDTEFIKQYCSQLLVDIAKFWISRLEYNEQKKAYEILDVVGPDEYKEHVNNNMYTNYTAKRTIELVANWEKLGLISKECLAGYNFEEANLIAQSIFLQTADEKNLIGQDDTYLNLDIIDLSKYKNSSKVAEINKDYSMEEKCQIQVGKQADLLLLFQMYREEFDKQTIEDNFTYYEDKCLHDSSLSLVTHNILACDLDQIELANEFFEKSFAIDYTGHISSSNEGIHFASMGGHWLSLIRGFANVYISDKLEINPKLPEKLQAISFSMHYLYSRLEIKVTTKTVSIHNQGTQSIECSVYGKEYIIESGDSFEVTK